MKKLSRTNYNGNNGANGYSKYLSVSPLQLAIPFGIQTMKTGAVLSANQSISQAVSRTAEMRGAKQNAETANEAQLAIKCVKINCIKSANMYNMKIK